MRFDPKTQKFQSWAIPGGGDIVRNMDVMPDGNAAGRGRSERRACMSTSVITTGVLRNWSFRGGAHGTPASGAG